MKQPQLLRVYCQSVKQRLVYKGAGYRNSIKALSKLRYVCFGPLSQMFNSLRSLQSQLSLKSKWESLKENEKTKKIFNFSKEIGHRRKTTNKNPFVLTEHYVATRHEAKGRECSVGKWRPWLFSGAANLSQPRPKSHKQGLSTRRLERTAMTERDGVLGLWKRELSWSRGRCVVFPTQHPSSFLLPEFLFPKRNPFHIPQSWTAQVPNFFGHSDGHVTGAVPEFSVRSDVWTLGKGFSPYLWDHKLKGSMTWNYQWSSCLPNHNQIFTLIRQLKHISKTANHVTTKQSQLSGHLFAILPKKVVFRPALPFPKI